MWAVSPGELSSVTQEHVQPRPFRYFIRRLEKEKDKTGRLKRAPSGGLRGSLAEIFVERF